MLQFVIDIQFHIIKQLLTLIPRAVEAFYSDLVKPSTSQKKTIQSVI